MKDDIVSKASTPREKTPERPFDFNYDEPLPKAIVDKDVQRVQRSPVKIPKLAIEKIQIPDEPV